jgi:polyvinyl alcohol dehydrogenase (cytochrome)
MSHAAGLLLSAFCLAVLLPHPASAQAVSGWPFAGADIENTRFGASETILSPSTVGGLATQWIYPATNDVSATPSYDPVSNGVYFPDWSGYITKLNATTGKVIWRKNVTQYGLTKGAMSRSTPTLAGGLVIFGASGALGLGVASPAYLNAVNPNNGNLVWQLLVDSDPNALITGSPVVYNNVIYVGVSSSEEKLANPVFQGSVIAVSLTNGALLWQTYMTVAGYTGAPIWSSTPAVDTTRNQLYVTTGNNYLVPESVEQCEQQAGGAGASASKLLACQSPENFADSIVALNLTTGAIVWAHHCVGEDNFIAGCNAGNPDCPNPKGKDYDFGAGANFFTTTIQGVPTDIVGAGQKSGTYWALDPDNGNVIWKTTVGPGGTLGGIEWGTAADGQQVYVAISNSSHAKYTLQPTGMSWNGGSWAALNAATGEIVWQVPDTGLDPVNPTLPADTLGPVTAANGVVYAASMSGAMYAFDAATGQQLWTYEAAGSVNAAPAVWDGVLYWGSGYHNFPPNPVGTASNQFYSFWLPPAPGKIGPSQH